MLLHVRCIVSAVLQYASGSLTCLFVAIVACVAPSSGASDSPDGCDVVASMQGFIKNSGQRSLNYDATNISKVAGGDTVEELEVRLGRYYAGRGRVAQGRGDVM